MLTGQAKKDYQRDYMRKRRAGLTGSNTGLTDRLKVAGLTMEGNRIIAVKKALPDVKIPLYNPAVHRAGDRVLVKPPYSKRLIEMVIPELDADGNAMPVLT